jgi:hypothetical protein
MHGNWRTQLPFVASLVDSIDATGSDGQSSVW